MIESAVNKLLHAPDDASLKARAAEGDDAGELAAAIRFLFDLQEIAAEKNDDRRSLPPSRPHETEGDERLAQLRPAAPLGLLVLLRLSVAATAARAFFAACAGLRRRWARLPPRRSFFG